MQSQKKAISTFCAHDAIHCLKQGDDVKNIKNTLDTMFFETITSDGMDKKETRQTTVFHYQLLCDFLSKVEQLNDGGQH